MTETPLWTAWPSLEARQANFDRLYATQKERFTGPPSRFSVWALERISARFTDGPILDLGCGLGRDARRFAELGYAVRAIDYSHVAIERASAHPGNPPGLRFERADALSALRSTETGSQVVVYAHALYMMLPDEELDLVFREVGRVLRPNGLHVFAVRSVTDPAAGRGDEVAPDVWRPVPSPLAGGPTPTPHRYFRPGTLDRLTATGFERVEAALQADSHFWYVVDRRA